MNVATKSCFVIRPIGDDGTEVRRHSDERYKHFITPVCLACGYTNVFFAADGPSKGMITHDVITHTIEADLVIADLVGHNTNVFMSYLSGMHSVNRTLALRIAQNLCHLICATVVPY